MGTKKIILIVAAVAIIGFFVFFMRKKGNGDSAKALSEGVKSMGANMANNAADAIKEVVLSDTDEEYNLLRQEYADRFGSAPKSSWSKAMIQQQINEFDRKSEALDKLVEVSGSAALEQTATMSEEEILRLIETEKQRVAQEKAKALRNAQLQYKSATNMNPSADLDTPEKLVDAMEKELINANEEYKAFMGVYPTGCVSAVQVRSKLENEKAAMRNEWQNRKNQLKSHIVRVAELMASRGLVSSKNALEPLFNEALQFSERDFYFWFENLYSSLRQQNRDSIAELQHIATNALFILHKGLMAAASSLLNRRNNGYRFMNIDEYGRVQYT